MPRPPERLTILNAKDLRQAVNQLCDADASNQTQGLKLIMTTPCSRRSRAAAEGSGDVGRAFQAARSAARRAAADLQGQGFRLGPDRLEEGHADARHLPENAIREIFKGGPEATTDLKKVEAVRLKADTKVEGGLKRSGGSRAAANPGAPPADPAAYARKFIRVARSDEVLAPLIASAAS